MPKSKYPEKLDTSVELPPVRDNIIEVGSDVINSLRSAIFQIERVLGINPQGAVGNTVADRLNRVLDGNGNILKTALDGANVLSGPILDSDVSEVAAIREKKLRLDFPTQLLQDEISIINGQLDNIIAQLTELSGLFAVHINVNATNRHPATAISVSSATPNPSDTSSNSLDSGSIQSVLETLYNAHINYSGANISSDNNSHPATQIYFDDTNVADILDADDVQEAIDELALASQNSQINHQDLFHSNGLLRLGKIDTSALDGVGRVLASDLGLSFAKSTGSSTNTTRVFIPSAPALGDFILEKSDILTITDTNDEDELFVGNYEIASVNLISGTDTIESVDIFGLLAGDSTPLTLGRLSKNINASTNYASFLVTAREDATLTSAKTAQVCNPNAVKITSSNIKPSEITVSNRFFNISIDEGTDIEIDVFNGGVNRQTIDSIVSSINEQCVEGALNILAYRLDLEHGGSELVIAHNLPDADADQHTLRVSRSSDGGFDSLGFSDIEDIIIESEFGSNYYISGIPQSGLKIKLDSTNLIFFASSRIVATTAGDDFLALGIKVNDIITISEATIDSDNGTFIITSVSANQLTLSTDQLPLGFTSASIEDTTRFRIFENIVSFDELTFEEVSGTFGSQILDIFIDTDKNVLSTKRIEYASILSGTSSLVDVVDFRGDIAGKQFKLIAEDADSFINLSLDGGPAIKVYGRDNYVWLLSGEENVWIKVFIQDSGAVKNQIVSDGADLEIDIFGFAGINTDTNLLISRVLYGSFNGRIAGGAPTAPRVLSRPEKGNIGIDELNIDVRRQLAERPVDELRSDGVIYGLEVVEATLIDDFYAISLERGVAYVKGRRFELDNIEQVITDVDSAVIDKFFVVLTDDGEIDFEPAVSDGYIECASPFGDSEYVILASIEFDQTNIEIIDLRLFISDIDHKLLNSITVSPQRGMGHFDDIPRAIKYAKRFSQIYPNAGVPTVHLKSGTHLVEVNIEDSRTAADYASDIFGAPETVFPAFFDAQIRQGFFVNFPVNIVGEGDSTVVDINNVYIFSDGEVVTRGQLVIPGDGFSDTPTIPFDKFNDGYIKLKNFTMLNSRIDLVDFNIEDAGGVPLQFGVNIENIHFNFRNFSSLIDLVLDVTFGPLAIQIADVDDTTTEKGNVKIKDCIFDLCMIGIDSGTILPSNLITLLRNIEISGNTVVGNIPFLTNGALLNVDLVSDLFINSESNINVFGNISASNFNPNDAAGGPKMVRGFLGLLPFIPWSERFSRDVRIGNDVHILGNYNYAIDPADLNSFKVKRRFYTVDQMQALTSNGYEIASGFTTPPVTQQALPAPAGTVARIVLGDVTVDQEAVFWHWPERTTGEILLAITIGVSLNVGLDWGVSIYNYNRTTAAQNLAALRTPGININTTDNIKTIIFGFIPNPAVPGALGSGYTVLGDRPELIAIGHNDTGGGRSLYWIEILTVVSSVEKGVGIIN